MNIKQKLKEEWKIAIGYMAIGASMLILYYWLFGTTVAQSPNYIPLEPKPYPHVVVLDTFSSTALKQEINRQNILYTNIVYNQARLETGNFKSQVFKENNNLFGFVGKKGYIKYNSWQESVKAYKQWQTKYYTHGSYYDFLQKIGYATDTEYVSKLKRFQ